MKIDYDDDDEVDNDDKDTMMMTMMPMMTILLQQQCTGQLSRGHKIRILSFPSISPIVLIIITIGDVSKMYTFVSKPAK